MYVKEEVTSTGDKITYIYADVGKKILIGTDILVDKVALGIYSKPEDFTEVDDATYEPPIEVIEDDPLLVLKKNQITLSKNNLANYLSENPLLSTCKYEEGRYYNVTAEKQQQMTSKALLATMYAQLGMPYNLTWNDTGDICESWELSQLQQLSMEIDAYVTPLISLQQTMEVAIQNCTTQEEVLQVNVEFTEEQVTKWIETHTL